MKKAVILAVVFIAFLGCKTKDAELATDKPSQTEYRVSKTSRFTVISDTSETKAVTGGLKQLWEPTEEQIHKIENIIKSVVSKDPRVGNRHLKSDSIDSIYKQYVCYVSSTGDSLVYVNASCIEREIFLTDSATKKLEVKKFDWLNKLFGRVLDGGDCFWNMRINFSQKSILEMNVNGEA